MDDSNRDDGTGDACWKNTLIRVYLFVYRRWSSGLCAVAQRQSNNSDPDFTDEEVLTIYLFGLIRKRETIKDIHEYAEDHFPEWFPDLPSCGGYVQRLNRLSAAFAPLTEAAIAESSEATARRQPLIRIVAFCEHGAIRSLGLSPTGLIPEFRRRLDHPVRSSLKSETVHQARDGRSSSSGDESSSPTLLMDLTSLLTNTAQSHD